MLTTIIPGNFKHIPELSVYDHNVYTDGKMYVLENYDECSNSYSYDKVDNLGNSIEYLGMTEEGYVCSIFTDTFIFIGSNRIDLDLNREVVLNSEYW